ncbi:YaaA family protein [Oceanispirochaeta crateris]|uniref:UPF0246 protein EXM22_12095 n=1 Tax=Oceanispirochaeta crateris TaxID=2518645 RepID=A0A5C1QKQ4_9SPIO|nr:YaaA family protein [Oceanispirochaeta crateris]QEN08693.1 YaaA family protein [Oceanispirochaeta crateris]
MIIIFSPTKQMNFSESSPKNEVLNSDHTPPFQKEAARLNGLLSEYSKEGLAVLMKMSLSLSEQTQRYISSFHSAQKKSAIYAYSGTSFLSLDAETLPEEALLYGQKHLRILSGMYGCLRPLDHISPYRLEMKTALSVGADKNLTVFWKKRVTEFLTEDESLARKNSFILNLASGEYSRIIDSTNLGRPMITVHFREESEGGLKTVGMYAKAARGAMLRHLLLEQTEEPEEIRKMKVNNYEFSESLSDDQNWIFIRGAQR